MQIFTTTLKVRTYECDIYGHVNNATFLNYLEFARIELLSELGFTLESLKKKGFILPLVKMEIEYKNPAFPGDELSISVKWIKRGRTSSVFGQTIVNGKTNQIIAVAKVTWVVTDLKGKPIAIPDELTHSFKKKFQYIP